MENFNWEIMVESRQYRAGGGRGLTLRQVANFAFLDLMTLYILHNEYEMAPVASNYSGKTIGYRNFLRPRLSGTDLYVSLNILANPDSVFARSIKQNPEADALLRSKLNVHLPTVKRYLELLEQGTITSRDTAQLLLRLEKQLNITDSQFKSMRRLVQDWNGLNQMQREILVTRMLQQYKKFAKRSELSVFLDDLGKMKGYEMRGPIDAELQNLAATPLGRVLTAVAPAAFLVGAYKLGHSLTAPPKNEH